MPTSSSTWSRLIEKKAAEIEAAKAGRGGSDSASAAGVAASAVLLSRPSPEATFPVSKLQPVRGTHDLLPDEFRRFAHVVDTARDVARLYGYREMATPIFEFTELFARGIGETTDVVSKEMYTFQDRGGEVADAAARIHRRHLPRLRVQRRAGAAAAAQAVRCRADVPLRAAAEGPPAPVPPDRPRGAGRARARRRHRGDLGRGRHPATGWASSTAACSSSIRSATRRAAPPIARCWSTTIRPPRQACREDSRDACSAIRCASSTARTRATRRSTPSAPSFADYLNQASRDFFARGAGRPGGGRHRLRGRSRPGARPRLLHPHRLRVRHDAHRRAGHRAGRRPLRRPDRRAGRAADRRHRLGGRHRAADDAVQRARRRCRGRS